MKSRHCAATNARRVTHTAGGLALAVGTILLAGVLPAQAQTGGNVAPDKTIPAAKTPAGAKAKAAPAAGDAKSQASYSLGVSFGTQLHGQYGLSSNSVTYERVLQGLKDALAGKVTATPEDGQRVQTLIQETQQQVGAQNKAAADKFLADNGKLPGMITTASGLQYKIDRPGNGALPKVTDEATVNYKGSLLDGTVFDSSYKRGQPANFPIGNVIKGWQEALVLMKPGSKFELFIPPDLAYGMNANGPIPPGSLLKFEVEMISAKPVAPAAGGAMSGPAPKHP